MMLRRRQLGGATTRACPSRVGRPSGRCRAWWHRLHRPALIRCWFDDGATRTGLRHSGRRYAPLSDRRRCRPRPTLRASGDAAAQAAPAAPSGARHPRRAACCRCSIQPHRIGHGTSTANPVDHRPHSASQPNPPTRPCRTYLGRSAARVGRRAAPRRQCQQHYRWQPRRDGRLVRGQGVLATRPPGGRHPTRTAGRGVNASPQTVTSVTGRTCPGQQTPPARPQPRRH